MRTMSMLAFMALALPGCGGSQKTVEGVERAGGEVQAERGEADGTPGLDAAIEEQATCWVVGEEGEGTPGFDASADSYQCSSS
jgi:hypothetical protein